MYAKYMEIRPHIARNLIISRYPLTQHSAKFCSKSVEVCFLCMNTSLLAHLNSASYVSGVLLASAFGCSRAAISKQVELLRTHGVLIESKPHHGYRLRYTYDWWTQSRVTQALDATGIDDVTVLSEVDSTNVWLRQHLQTKSSGQALALSDFQVAGKGRRGKSWLSPPGRQIALSLGISAKHSPLLWIGLALAVGVEVAEALQAINLPVSLKWPNDIELNGAKLGGILVEMEADFDGPSRVIIGLGLNEYLLPEERLGLGREVAAIQDHVAEYDRYQLVADLSQRLSRLLEQYPDKGLLAWQAQWQSLDALRNQHVEFQHQDAWVTGLAQGIDAQGCLLVETANGVIRCHSGEVSLRGAQS
jgi:BirA family biotin operon repressor/biotin-[acetyl-CoA-carboxylase] ligase